MSEHYFGEDFAPKASYALRAIIKKSGRSVKFCEDCGVKLTKKNRSVHHVNGNHEDVKPANLMILCRPCHIKRHKKGEA